MGFFRNIFRAAAKVTSGTFYLGGLYTFFGYFYVQEVKYRLGDSQKCQAIQAQQAYKQMIQNQGEQPSNVQAILLINNIFTFYLRTWNFRQYESICKHYHKNVIQSILKNYKQYGILSKSQQMEEDIKRQEINPSLLANILQVKELNVQIMNLYADQYIKIVEKQKQLRTGNLIGLTQQQARSIDLIFQYIERGQKMIFKNEQKFWEYKMLQNDTRRHRYNDTVFRLLFI